MSKLEPRLGSHLAPGAIAVALFGVLAWVFLNASFAEPAGFGDASVIESLGFALLNIQGPIPTEGFLVAFLLIAFVLDAALDGAILLARRDEEEGGLMTALGGRGGDDEE